VPGRRTPGEIEVQSAVVQAASERRSFRDLLDVTLTAAQTLGVRGADLVSRRGSSVTGEAVLAHEDRVRKHWGSGGVVAATWAQVLGQSGEGARAEERLRLAEHVALAAA
jgi:hypothetical protein